MVAWSVRSTAKGQPGEQKPTRTPGTSELDTHPRSLGINRMKFVTTESCLPGPHPLKVAAANATHGLCDGCSGAVAEVEGWRGQSCPSPPGVNPALPAEG